MLRGHVFSEQIFGVNIFALFINQFLGGNNGIIQSYKNAMSMTNTTNTITVDTGVCVIQGRYIEEHTGSVINYAKSDNLYCSLVLEIDLGKTNTKTSFVQAYYKVLEGENSYPTLTQNDIANENGNIYQFELARFQNGSSGITNFTDRRSYLSFDSVYSGIIQDNLTSDSSTSALSAKQGKILNEKFSPNIITAVLASPGYTISTTGDYEKLPLTLSNSLGTKLTMSNNAVVIGNGVSKIKISFVVLNDGTTIGRKYVTIYRNGTGEIIALNSAAANNIVQIVQTPIILNVNENDVIDLRVYGTKDDNIYAYRTYMTVEVID